MDTGQQSATPNPQFAIRNPQSAIKGFIQAGGRSSRMNRDKAWLEIEGVTMIERVIAAARPVAGRLGIIVNAANPQIERYEKLAESCEARLIFDLHEHLGPLGGIHTALAHCGAGASALILACDLPFITTEFLSFIRDIHQNQNPQSATQQFGRNPQAVTVPLDQSNRPQPLAAVYDQSLEATVAQMLAANELKVDLLYSRISTRRVFFADFAHLRDAELLFVNVNTPEEYFAALKTPLSKMR
ncbi:MAG TPA: molybdenum cofactor guanylyltransferase [Blastocatellia bacterium]|jgi:molybdopterin-guanine dinucleotide biosynthesis protein A|nr:molybdenum cofactor guanylyltransferase [Blastocatellia bacterium]